ncbi:MAG: DMT family transporter [Alphaproteobacteria bacterium]
MNPAPPAIPPSAPRPWLKYLFLSSLGLIWGSSYMLNIVALKSVTPLTVTTTRIFLGGLIMLAVARAQGYRLPRDPRTWLLLIAFGVIGQAMSFGLVAFGQLHVGSGLTGIIITIVPLFTLVLAHLLTKDERITPPKAAGVIMALIGILLLLGPAALAGLGGHFWGQMMMVGGAFTFSLSMIIAKWVRHVPFPVSASCSLLSAAVVLMPLALVIEHPWTLQPTLLSSGAVIVLGVFGTAIGMLILFRLVAMAGAAFVSLNNYIATIVAVLWGVLLLGEPLTWLMIGAMAVIFSGIAVANLRWPPRGTSLP